MPYHKSSRPADDEAALVRDVDGFCWSEKCKGNRRSARMIVYGSGEILIRCKKCSIENKFYLGSSPGLDSNWTLSNDPVEEVGHNFIYKVDQYKRYKGRK